MRRNSRATKNESRGDKGEAAMPGDGHGDNLNRRERKLRTT